MYRHIASFLHTPVADPVQVVFVGENLRARIALSDAQRADVLADMRHTGGEIARFRFRRLHFVVFCTGYFRFRSMIPERRLFGKRIG